MICTVIQHKTFPRISEILGRVEMAEIRLDRCSLTDEEIEACFESDTPTVATCRVSEIMAAHPELSETKAASICEDLLCKAIRAGARYVDVEIEAPKYMSKRVRACAQEYGSTFIKSYHDFERTESLEVLKNMVEKCRHHGAELVKIVTTAHDLSDPDNVLALYDYFPPAELIAFSMGEAGKQSRLQCLAKGAPYTYAALSEDDSAAPGQWTVSEMSETLYRGRSFVNASIVIPSSKSFAQRAIIAAALADGTSRLSGYSPCGDNEAAIAAAAAIGAEVNSDGDVLLHALMDALLGCLGEGDIGQLFPDSDPALDNVSSCVLLDAVLERARQRQLRIEHVDLTIVAQKPRVSPHREAIRGNVARLLGLAAGRVCVKATTEEHLGFTGQGLGLKAVALVTASLPLA